MILFSGLEQDLKGADFQARVLLCPSHPCRLSVRWDLPVPGSGSPLLLMRDTHAPSCWTDTLDCRLVRTGGMMFSNLFTAWHIFSTVRIIITFLKHVLQAQNDFGA